MGRQLSGALGLVLAASLALAGCGGSDEPDATASPGSSEGANGSSDEAGGSPESGQVSPGPSNGNGDGSDPAGTGSSPASDGTEGPLEPDDGAPGEPDKAGGQGDVFERVPGERSAGCVDVGDGRDVRSGGFVAGAWDDARSNYRPSGSAKQVRLYWIPLHTRPMPGVTVTATQGDASVKVVQRRVADTEDWKFYDTTVTLKRPGTWTFRVAAGRDRGCFRASFG